MPLLHAVNEQLIGCDSLVPAEAPAGAKCLSAWSWSGPETLLCHTP